MSKDTAVIIVNRNRPDLTDALVEQLRGLPSADDSDVYVVECGSEPDRRSQYASFGYDDPDFRGKCFGHVYGLERVRELKRDYRYYWFLMNDLVFDEEPDPLATLKATLSAEPRMGLISPTELDSGYPASKPIAGSSWHKVSTTDYLAIMMKSRCLDEVGFLNPDFRYSWGAIHELSYKMYRAGWFLAYSDLVVMKHLGGTTYGAAAKTIARDEYQRRAKQWAARYFVDEYGPDWSKRFASQLPADVAVDTYTLHRRYWESAIENQAPSFLRRSFRRVRRSLGLTD